MKKVSVMIDIETLDVKPNSSVLSAGLVTFSEIDNIDPWNMKHIVLDTNQQTNRTVSEDTVNWWNQRDPEVKKAAFTGGIDVKTALEEIKQYFDDILVNYEINNVWGQGYGFDMTILGTLFEDFGVEAPWQFFQLRDSRTLFKLLKADPRPEESRKTLHRADFDAYWQAKGVQSAYNLLNIKEV